MIRGNLHPKVVEGLTMKDRLDVHSKTDQTTKTTFMATRFKEFCKRTDLHGYKYMVMQDLTLPERAFWGLALVVSVTVATYFVITAYKWYARNPIITVIESTHGAIWDVPFPAVTLCDLNMISHKKARVMAKTLSLPEDVSPDQFMELLRQSPLMFLSNFDSPPEQLEQLQAILELNNVTIPEFFTQTDSSCFMCLGQLSPATQCTDLVERCMWKNAIYRCELLFYPIFTQFSLCCSFNYYAIDGVSQSSNREMFHPRTPRRVSSCGYQTALTLILNTEPEDYFSAAIASYGLVVFVDNAYNLPDLNSPLRIVSPSTEVFLALSPERTYATSGIRSFAPEERQCYFNNEVKLGKYNQYTYHNCMVYNKAASIVDTCGCNLIFFPNTGSHRTCNFTDMTCIGKVILSRHNTPRVKCLPDCEHYDYPLEVAQGMLATDVPMNGLAFYKDIDLRNKSLLNIFFNDLVTTRYRRDVYLNWQNLLASFGGLLSLMLGFTLISALDFVIFFTFRLTYDAFRSVAQAQPAKVSTGAVGGGWLKSNRVHVQEFSGRDPWPWLHDEKPTKLRY